MGQTRRAFWLGVSLFLLLPAAARADFTAPSRNISNSPLDSLYPKVVRLPGTDELVVCWIETDGSTDSLLASKSTDGGATWGAPVTLSGSGQMLERADDKDDFYAVSMSLDDPDGPGGPLVPIIHIARQWRASGAEDFEILYIRSTDAGSTWNPDGWVTLTNNSTPSRHPDVAARFGYVHVVYQDSWPGNEEVMYKRILENGGGLVDQTRRLTVSSSESSHPRVAASLLGYTVHVAYQDDGTGVFNIFYKRLSNYGSGSSLTRQLTTAGTPGDFNGLPDVTTSTGQDDQYVYIVYQALWPGNREIMYKRLNNWGEPGGTVYTARLTYSATESRSTAIDFDSASNYVQITYHDNWPGNYDVMFRKFTNYGGGGFTGQRVSWGAGDSSQAGVAASGAFAYVVWSDNTSGNYEVYVKYGN